MSTVARSAFRKLYRAQKSAFRSDLQMSKVAVSEIRTQFQKNKNVTNPEELNALMKQAEEAEEFLKYHLAQGKLKDDGRYEFQAEDLDEHKASKAKKT